MCFLCHDPLCFVYVMLHDVQVLVLVLFSNLLSLYRIVINVEGQALGFNTLILTLNISIHEMLQWELIYG